MKRVKLSRLLSASGVVGLIAALLMQAMPPITANAATPELAGTRSLTLEAGLETPEPYGGSLPGSGTANNTAYQVQHNFNFGVNAGSTVGAVSFQYCTTAEPVSGGIGCVVPTGLDLTNAAFESSTGIASGFTTLTLSHNADSGTVKNEITEALGTATNVSGSGVIQVGMLFKGIQNPSTANTTFFVRIVVYSDTTATTAIEGGTVAASTTNEIVLQGNMPESLIFCTGGTVGETNGVPDCTTATSGAIQFNALFSPTSTAYSTSQMAASTNAETGYAITVNGTTLTSGSNSIKAMTTAGQSEYGVSQFGMNLALNDGAAYTNAPDINTTDLPPSYAGSANITPASNTTNYRGEAYTGYNAYTGTTPDNGLFKFNPGDTVADSGYDSATPGTPGATVGTDAQIYTVSYIANVPGSQGAGTYTADLTYICTATY